MPSLQPLDIATLKADCTHDVTARLQSGNLAPGRYGAGIGDVAALIPFVAPLVSNLLDVAASGASPYVTGFLDSDREAIRSLLADHTLEILQGWIGRLRDAKAGS